MQVSTLSRSEEILSHRARRAIAWGTQTNAKNTSYGDLGIE